jgi:hypothetical protein
MGELESAPWRGVWQEQVSLQLRASFELGGRVGLPGLDETGGECRIAVAGQFHNLWRDLASLRDVHEGEWGPLQIPLCEADRYRIRLEGSSIIPAEVCFSPPSPGARVTKSLVAEPGVRLSFVVHDMAGAAIPDARVKAQWQDREDPYHWFFTEAETNGEAAIDLFVPRGSFKYEGQAPGHVPAVHGPSDTASCEGFVTVIALQKAGVLRGRVSHGGRPVPDFEIITWKSGMTTSRASRSFFDRADGTFELDTIPTGEFWVTANSAKTPACEPVQVSLPSGGETEVVLELSDGLPGRGRVIDQRTGAPLPEASIHLFVKGDVTPAARWGLPVPVKPDGTFEVGGYLPGANFIRAVAEGYSSQVVKREAEEGSVLDWGDLALVPSQDLTLLLEPAESARGATAHTKGTTPLPTTSFSEDGSLVYPSTNAGPYSVLITEADGETTQIEVNLVSGKDWTVRTRIAGDNRLSVLAMIDGRSAMERVNWVVASYQSLQGYRTIRTKGNGGIGRLEIEGIDGPTVSVQLFGEEGVLATAGGAFQGGYLALDIPLDGHSLSVWVTDRSGEPVAEARVTLAFPDLPGLVFEGGTDANGECILRGVPKHEGLVSVRHGTLGFLLDAPVDAGQEGVEVVLDGSARIELALRDREAELPSVTCALLNRRGSVLLTDYSSDENGRATIANLTAGEYHMRATRPDCWAVDFMAKATTDDFVQTVQVRRLGDLELQVLTAEGQPVTGVPLELSSHEFGTDVGEWIREGRVPATELVTDSTGRIRVAKLPRGSYRWRLLGFDGGPTEGTLEVLPAQSTLVRIALH